MIKKDLLEAIDDMPSEKKNNFPSHHIRVVEMLKWHIEQSMTNQ